MRHQTSAVRLWVWQPRLTAAITCDVLATSKRVTRTHLPRQCCGGGRIISVTYIMKNATTKHVGWLHRQGT